MARILIVDDSPTDVASIRLMLERAGHEVLESPSGQDAIACAQRQPVDCILMDVIMPGVNGFQATRTLSKDPKTAHIPIIVISSKTQETDKLWAKRQGAKDYIVKPIKESELTAKIESVLGG